MSVEEPNLTSFYVDLHVHIGATEAGRPVKISASKNLTFYHIAEEASKRKGIDLIGIIDAHSPSVQSEIESYLANGEMEELAEGGIRFKETTIILGCELEVKDKGFGAAHLLTYFPTFEKMKAFTAWLKTSMKNVELSSQRIYQDARMVQEKVAEIGGILIPAHIFTPFKSTYGSCSSRMADILDVTSILAVELGLSADSEMAGYLSELENKTFVTNSDAHSLAKIGREYNRMALASANYTELLLALRREQGRKVEANYGLNPRLGKYHRTFCTQCDSILDEEAMVQERCVHCGSTKMVKGVMDRILQIADCESPIIPSHRPPYIYQVPLEFLPGLGGKKLNKLLEAFGTEMNILHRVSFDQLCSVVEHQLAEHIVAAREGRLLLSTGGGGTYGKVLVINDTSHS